MPISLKQDLEAVDKVLATPAVAKATEPRPFGVAISDILGLKTLAAKECLRVALANILLIDRKQQDYGPHNIASAGAFGCAVRLNDKSQRLLYLYAHGRRRKAIHESIEDSFRDACNYGIIASVVELGRWPNV
jgi:hypothetical protein